ncbi:hypothetical protein [Gillisia hiemivivida]|nr:hypothetical protein [Gillisia hiemivivida]
MNKYKFSVGIVDESTKKHTILRIFYDKSELRSSTQMVSSVNLKD